MFFFIDSGMSWTPIDDTSQVWNINGPSPSMEVPYDILNRMNFWYRLWET